VLLALPAAARALPPGWVRLSDIAPGIAQDIRYARAFNFTGAPVPGYDAAECILRQETAQALARVQADLAAEGLGLIVWDCYRPLRAVAHFAAWTKGDEGPDLSAVFFPGLTRGDLIPQGYVAPRSSHALGGTVDLGLVRLQDPVLRPTAGGRCDGPFATRAAESGLDMGTAFDCFSPLSGTAAAIPDAARANRDRLTRAMQAQGFAGYDAEWWHFRLPLDGAEPQDFPLR
jgi:D-alanyl-D-alanine dipeptidase